MYLLVAFWIVVAVSIFVLALFGGPLFAIPIAIVLGLTYYFVRHTRASAGKLHPVGGAGRDAATTARGGPDRQRHRGT